MKVRVTPTAALAGNIKGAACEAGCYLLEELGDKNEATLPIGEHDTLETRCIFELGFRKSVARHHVTDWISHVEIILQ